MPIRDKWIGSQKPATQADLADLQEDAHAEIDQAEQRIKKEIRKEVRDSEKRLESKFASKEDLKGVMSKETGEELLEYVKSIDKRLKKQEDLPERVTKLENDVFKLKLQR